MSAKLPGLGGTPLGADAGPIQPELRELMNAVARGLDDVFNGEGCKPEDKKVWFFLAAGGFDHAPEKTPDTSRFNYISNADKLDVRATLRDVLARLEARMFEGGRA
jgi:hypothetical protein